MADVLACPVGAPVSGAAVRVSAFPRGIDHQATERASPIQGFQREGMELHCQSCVVCRDTVAAYLTDIIAIARDVLSDRGIDPESPIGSYELLTIFNRERDEQSADDFVAVRLFENATIARNLLKAESPTANELRFAVVAMAEIADLLHIADIRAVTREPSEADNTARDMEIRRRRYRGQSFKTIRKQMKLELSDKQLALIAPKRNSE